MPETRLVLRCLAGLLLMLLAACAAPPETAPRDIQEERIAELRADILALGPGIDPAEAAEAARIAITYPLELRALYEVSDSAIVHNMKVNAGLRPRGLCFHWADDLQKALVEARFETLDLHRAIANSERVLRIEHSTVLVSAPGAVWTDALVLDPWRYGGTLYWGPPLEDTRYAWQERETVFERKRSLAR